jgi:hypothetical protein
MQRNPLDRFLCRITLSKYVDSEPNSGQNEEKHLRNCLIFKDCILPFVGV